MSEWALEFNRLLDSEPVWEHGKMVYQPALEALKFYRQVTGCGLKEAFDYVEAVRTGKKPRP